jgi:selenocysteine-specific elongation factor
MSLELLRQVGGGGKVAEYVRGELVREGRVVPEGNTARLAEHAPALDQSQETTGRTLLAALVSAGDEGRTLAELDDLGGGSAGDLVEYYVRQGTVVRIGQDRYYDRMALERLARKALVEIDRVELATPAHLREKLGLSRKYLIPLLEWLDLKGFTLRAGDGRRVTKLGLQHLQSGA